jgi:purine-binding chemotaxis protein CheW
MAALTADAVADLQLRARRLREAFDRGFAQAERKARGPQVDLLLVQLGGEPHGIRLSAVGGLHADHPITPLPTELPALLGLAAFRGTLVPVYHLPTLMGYAPTTPGAPAAAAKAGASPASPARASLLSAGAGAVSSPGHGGGQLLSSRAKVGQPVVPVDEAGCRWMVVAGGLGLAFERFAGHWRIDGAAIGRAPAGSGRRHVGEVARVVTLVPVIDLTSVRAAIEAAAGRGAAPAEER